MMQQFLLGHRLLARLAMMRLAPVLLRVVVYDVGPATHGRMRVPGTRMLLSLEGAPGADVVALSVAVRVLKRT